MLGEDAFRTGTGVHAAAIIKARKKGHDWLADRIYSGVPAGDFGLAQKIEVSHVSGLSNVKWWLEAHGHDPEDAALCQRIFDAAKATSRTLRDEELEALVAEHQPAGGERVTGTLDQILDGYLDLRWEINPVEATYHGIHAKDGEFGRCDAESIRLHLAALKSYEHALEEVEPDGARG